MNKCTHIFLAIILTGISLYSNPPVFSERVLMDEFKIQYSASPTITDWDGDGLNDILVGYAYYLLTAEKGTVAFLKNTGTKTVPVFTRMDDLKANGEYIVSDWDA